MGKVQMQSYSYYYIAIKNCFFALSRDTRIRLNQLI